MNDFYLVQNNYMECEFYLNIEPCLWRKKIPDSRVIFKGKEIIAQTHLYDLRFDLELGPSLTVALIVTLLAGLWRSSRHQLL